ncbi:MAG: GNAT family N-acetyltransferase [Archangium sp.]
MRLIEATDAQQLERDALTWQAWGAGLTAEQFVKREKRLREHVWSRRTMKSFWWVDECGAPLSSCELFLDDAYVGERRGKAGIVASVFTEEKLRGKGHAAAMLSALTDRVRERDDVLALTLFSEIGVDLYQRVGFYAVPSFDSFFTPLSERPASVHLVERELPIPRDETTEPTTLRQVLTPARLDWHLERERIYGEVMAKPRLPFHGAVFGDASITFTAYWKTNELQVLTLDARTAADATQLIDAARHAAHLLGLPTVRVWETEAFTGVLPGGERRARTDEIPMFLPIAPGIEAWTHVERALWA